MTPKALEKAFNEAVNSINNHVEPFPADVLLKLYAYYKRATNDQSSPGSSNPLINAFKTNALFQTRGLTSNEAKKKYIETVNQYFLYRK
ncbi:MAG TPA: acyl-CoA-binding protein [Flavobacteriaceae bacterium]|nr:acyl-CoA-binding protein [Flavobacteriaceae bacterium]MCB9213607.1 acyl-CoA-binding protein [Alteromonas sp.]HPF12108.1 acyl-CoA-binding protein [Flavobacteriaceae bacterium]HQU21461.1 acyl-CoA-binding protein [Flavobacteriaceae bacterium]HQU65611.1 acyl-CoA-binding protein [Flavobacteriaceae bacterium]